jgi:hypothetical protein
MKLKYISLAIISILFFQGCTQQNLAVKDVFKTENAVQIQSNYRDICDLLAEYKQKLDKRNPQAFSKVWEKPILQNIKTQNNNISLSQYRNNYTKYLKKAFNTSSNIKQRNDYLILGFYKLLFMSYDMDNEKFTALNYNIKNFEKLSKLLQVIQWQVNHTKDDKNNYLFLTWQNNWQIELARKTNSKNPNYNLIKDLKYIKSNKESVFNPSNMSFESILSKMLYINDQSIKRLGGEPDELSLKALKSFLILL